MNTPQEILCPRCGYDLSGAREAALAAPPMPAEGICSECGLHFNWKELDSGRLNTPDFSYEHGLVYNLSRFARTCARSITGWRLWGPLAMRHEIQPMRLLAFSLLCLLVCHTGAFALDVAAVRFGYLGGWQYASGSSFAFSIGVTLTPAAPPATPPGALFVAPGGIPVTPDQIMELAVWPYGVHPGSGPTWMPGGLSLSLDLQIILACALAQCGTPTLLLGLRQTRHQFRLRKVHILRALCLGIPFFAASFVAVQLACSLAAWVALGIFLDRGALAAVGAAVFLSAEIFWWWCFCSRYLKAPHALGVACSGAIIAALLCVILALLSHSNLLWSLLG